MRLCYSEYEKYFIQTVSNSSNPTQTRGKEKDLFEGTSVNLGCRYQEAPTTPSLTDRHQRLTQLVYLGFQTQLYSKAVCPNSKLSFLITSVNYCIQQML